MGQGDFPNRKKAPGKKRSSPLGLSYTSISDTCEFTREGDSIRNKFEKQFENMEANSRVAFGKGYKEKGTNGLSLITKP